MAGRGRAIQHQRANRGLTDLHIQCASGALSCSEEIQPVRIGSVGGVQRISSHFMKSGRERKPPAAGVST